MSVTAAAGSDLLPFVKSSVHHGANEDPEVAAAVLHSHGHDSLNFSKESASGGTYGPQVEDEGFHEPSHHSPPPSTALPRLEEPDEGYVSEDDERVPLRHRPSSKLESNGEDSNVDGAMVSGPTEEVLDVIASKDVSQITAELGTRERMLHAAEDDLAKYQHKSKRDPENPKFHSRISEAKQRIQQEQENMAALKKAEKTHKSFFSKMGDVMQSPMGQMGMMAGLPMGMSALGSLGGKDSDAKQTPSSGAGPGAPGASSGQSPPPSGTDPQALAAGINGGGPLSQGQIKYLTSGLGDMPTMPGAYPGGNGFASSLNVPTASFVG